MHVCSHPDQTLYRHSILFTTPPDLAAGCGRLRARGRRGRGRGRQARGLAQAARLAERAQLGPQAQAPALQLVVLCARIRGTR